MEQAIAYIRVSTDRQATDGSSLKTQKRRVEEYAQQKGYVLDRIFSEEGESAKTDDRHVLQAMLVYAKQNRGRLQVLIFPKIDRFARYSADYHLLKRNLRDLGLRVESTDERFDESPSGKFLESVLAAQAQYDNDVRSERAKNSLKEAVAEGRWVSGRAPIGFRNTVINGKATIEPDPLKGPIIAEAFDRLAWKGTRTQDVRRWLAQKGVVRSPSGFDHMLKNEIYIGTIKAYGLVVQGRPPLVPLVPEATYYKALAAIRPLRSPKVHQRDRIDFPLRGTLKCSCGMFLTASWSKGRRKTYPYYRCKGCRRVNLARSIVHRAFVRDLRLLKRMLALTTETREELIHAWKDEWSSELQRRANLERDITTLTELQSAIVQKNATGIVPDDAAREQLRELAIKLAEKKAQRKEPHPNSQDIGAVLDFAEQFVDSLEHYWGHGDLATKKHMQAFFYPKGATVEFRSQGRTAKTAPSTGSPSGVHTQFSSSARRAAESPNRAQILYLVPREVLTDPAELLVLLNQVHVQFGRVSKDGLGLASL